MTTINKYFDLVLPQIILPSKNYEKLGKALRIKNTDSLQSRKAVFKLARYFRREAKIDSVLFSNPSYNGERDSECFAYVFTLEHKYSPKEATVVGGFCFRLRNFGFGLQWIWLHPFIRHHGLLKMHWSLLKEKFGNNFYVEPPYTYAMRGFLKTVDSIHSDLSRDVKIPSWLDGIVDAENIIEATRMTETL